MPTVVERVLGSESLALETGKLAFQSHGAVTLRYGETVILATAVMSDRGRPEIDFLPSPSSTKRGSTPPVRFPQLLPP